LAKTPVSGLDVAASPTGRLKELTMVSITAHAQTCQSIEIPPSFAGPHRRVFTGLADCLILLLPRTAQGRYRRTADKHAALLDIVCRKVRHYGGPWQARRSYLAYCLRCSERHVKRIVRELADLGILVVRQGGRQRGDWSAYAVDYSALDRLFDTTMHSMGDKKSPLNDADTFITLNQKKKVITVREHIGNERPEGQRPVSMNKTIDGKATAQDRLHRAFNSWADTVNWQPAERERMYGLVQNLINGYTDRQGQYKRYRRGRVAGAILDCINDYRRGNTGAKYYKWLEIKLANCWDADYFDQDDLADRQPSGILPELAAGLAAQMKANADTARYDTPAPERPARLPSAGPDRATLERILAGLSPDSPARTSIQAALDNLLTESENE